MSGKSSDGREKSGKNKTLTVANPASSTMSAHEDLLLTTKHQILMENHESLKQDYTSLEQRLKHVEQMNAMMRPCFQSHSQSKELEATNLGLLKDLERERNEYKMMVEEMKRMESENEATINELRIRNEELLIVLEKEEEEKRMMESKYDELSKRFRVIEKECSLLKSLYDDAKKLNGQGKNNVALEDEIFVVGENHNVNNNNTVTDAIVLSDSSDGENDNPTREDNISPPLPVGIKQEEECSNGVNLSQVKHPLWSPSSSSSSSSSSSDVYLVPLKRPRDDYNKC